MRMRFGGAKGTDLYHHAEFGMAGPLHTAGEVCFLSIMLLNDSLC